MEIIMIFCLLLIIMLLALIAGELLRSVERKLAEEKRTEQRAKSKEQLRQDALMREVEKYNGDV